MQHRAISNVIGILVGAVGFSLMPATQAQFNANFQTNVISGVTSNWGGATAAISSVVIHFSMRSNSSVVV